MHSGGALLLKPGLVRQSKHYRNLVTTCHYYYYAGSRYTGKSFEEGNASGGKEAFCDNRLVCDQISGHYDRVGIMTTWVCICGHFTLGC